MKSEVQSQSRTKIRKGILFFAMAISCVAIALVLKSRRTSQPQEAAIIETAMESNEGVDVIPNLAIIPHSETDKLRLPIKTGDLVVTNTERPNSLSGGRITAAIDAQHRKIKVPLADADLRNIAGRTFKKDEWHDAGSETISSLVENYYFAMREGDLARMSNCLSPMELLVWPARIGGRESVVQEEFATALHNATEYQIQSIAEFGDDYIVAVRHVMANGNQREEHFAVINLSNEWKIAGTIGELNYPHHVGGDLSRYEWPWAHQK
jgi:hypothetical protein